MNDQSKQLAERCLRSAEDGSMTFPQVVGTLVDGGFESYVVDFRQATATYYRLDGESIVLNSRQPATVIAPAFDAAAVQNAICEAQQQVPAYTYAGFCQKVRKAGCAGYIVSFSGRRAVYFGRTAETHVEYFPQ